MEIEHIELLIRIDEKTSQIEKSIEGLEAYVAQDDKRLKDIEVEQAAQRAKTGIHQKFIFGVVGAVSLSALTMIMYAIKKTVFE